MTNLNWTSVVLGVLFGVSITFATQIALITWLLRATLEQMRDSGKIVDECVRMTMKAVDALVETPHDR